MATITPHKRKDGTVAYTVQIKIMREGKFVFQKSHHFHSGEELETKLHRYALLYNQPLP